VKPTPLEPGSKRPVRRGRPPKSEHRAAVLQATRVLLATEGYDALTMEAIAAESGLYRKYLHRTWPSKVALVRDAIFEDVADFVTPDLGEFVADVHALVTQHVDLVRRPEFLVGLSSVQTALRSDPDLWEDTVIRHVKPPEEAFARVLGRAVERGEISDHLPPSVILNTVSGALQQLARVGELSRDELINHGTALVTRAMVTLR
jgi:AcrR family transcriptional regulator